MDSISPSTATITTTKSLSAVASNPYLSNFSQLTSYRTTQTRRVAPKISLNSANNNNGNHQTLNTTHVQNHSKMDRRNTLIGLGGLCGAATILSGGQPTLADTAVPTVTFPKALDHIIRTNIQRPRKSRSKSEKEDEEEILVVDMEVRKDVYSKFDVYVNDEDARPTKENRAKTEYAGSFVNVPHKHKNERELLKTSFKLGLTDLIEDLGADDDGIDVIFVPRTGSESLVIKDVRIEFL